MIPQTAQPETPNDPWTFLTLARQKGIESKRKKLLEDVADLATFTAGLEIPGRETLSIAPDFKRVYWTEQECDALFSAFSKVWPEFMRSRAGCSEYDVSRRFFLVLSSVAKRILPEDRQRVIIGWGTVPPSERSRYSKLTGLAITASLQTAEDIAPQPDQTSEAPPSIPAPDEKPRKINWGTDEQRALMIHLSHLMRKQGWKSIPQTEDRTGCIMFNDMVRLAQSNALPLSRRKDMSFPRGVLIDSDMMPRLEAMARLPMLPHLPAPLPEPEVLKPAPVLEHLAPPAAIAPVHHLNGNAHEPSPRRLEDYSDAELFQAATVRLLQHLNRRPDGPTETEMQLAKLTEELHSDFRLLSDANKEIEEKFAQANLHILELERRLNAITTEATRTRAPRVAILGCRKDQFDILTAKVAERGMNLDLRHYEQQGAKVVDVFADYAVLMPGIGHTQEHHVKQVVPRGQYVFISEFSVQKAVAQLVCWFQPSTIL